MRKSVYFLRQALDNIRLNLFASATSVIMLTLCLLVVGLFGIVAKSVQQLVPSWMLDVKAIAYLRADISPQEMESLVDKIRQTPEVGGVESVTKEQARQRLAAQLGDWQGVLGQMQENPLTPSLEIRFNRQQMSPADVEAVLDGIRGSPAVEEILYGKTWTQKLRSVLDLTKALGLALTGLLALAAVIVVANTVKLAILERQDELEVYTLLGATPLFTRLPFYLEGISQGFMAALVATVCLTSLAIASRRALPLPVAATLAWSKWDFLVLSTGILSCGIALSWLGAWLALRRFLHLSSGQEICGKGR